MSNDVLLVAVGCVTGVLAGMLGAGGGFATVVLLLAAGASAHVAVGTSLVYLMVMGGWGTFVHLRLRSVDRRLAIVLGAAAAVSGVAGAELGEALSSRDLVLSLGLLTACVSGISLAWPQARRPLVTLPGPAPAGDTDVPAPEPKPKATVPKGPVAVGPDGLPPDRQPVVEVELGRRELGASVVGGAVIGLLKGLFAVGAAFLIVPVVVAVAKVPRKLAVGSSLFAILVASIAAGFRHWMLGNIDGSALLWLVPGGLFGSFVGARAARSMSPASLRRTLLAVMAASTVYLLALAASY